MSERHGDREAERALERAYHAARDYLAEVSDMPASAPVTQAEVRARLGDKLKEDGEPSADVIEALIAAADGALAPTVGGRFFAYVIGGTHPAGVAADWLNAAWDDPAGTPLVSPFGCAVDGIVAEWALELLDLPRDASVGITTGATIGNFVGVASARHALLEREGWDVEADGLIGAPPIEIIVGEDAHPTLFASLRFAGLGAGRARRVAVDDQGAMRADAFAEALKAAKGPVLVCAQAGNLNSGAFDPFNEIAPLCRARGAWLHVDGAFGLWGRVSPQTRPLLEGVELADSWSTDAHKWLNTPYDAGFAIVADRAAHVGSMSVSASYLPQQDGARDPSHYVPELSRRGRATPIYATLRAIGRKGVRDTVETCCAHARLMRDLLTAAPGVECLNDVVLNQATFRFRPRPEIAADDDAAGADALTAEVVRRVRESAECWVQTSVWRGRTVMRFSVSDRATRTADIERAAAAILNALAEARAHLATPAK